MFTQFPLERDSRILKCWKKVILRSSTTDRATVIQCPAIKSNRLEIQPRGSAGGGQLTDRTPARDTFHQLFPRKLRSAQRGRVDLRHKLNCSLKFELREVKNPRQTRGDRRILWFIESDAVNYRRQKRMKSTAGMRKRVMQVVQRDSGLYE